MKCFRVRLGDAQSLSLMDTDYFIVISSIFPEALISSDGDSCTIELGLEISVLVSLRGMIVSSPTWTRREQHMHNEELAKLFNPVDGAVADPVEAILWCKERWVGPSDHAAAAGSASSCSLPSGALEQRLWLGFIGFYTPSIRQAFVAEARSLGLTGFLMPGKPAVAALEGDKSDISRFLIVTRTQLFASVPPASRKMTVMLVESSSASGSLHRAFKSFDEIELRCEPGTHARRDIADLGALRALLDARGLGHINIKSLVP